VKRNAPPLIEEDNAPANASVAPVETPALPEAGNDAGNSSNPSTATQP
jgi:hypothetical protein